jgi:hypothetical protein
MRAFTYNSPEFLQVKDKLDAFALAAGDHDYDGLDEGVLVDDSVPFSWWQRTDIWELPFKVVYHTETMKLFAIELGGPHQESAIQSFRGRLAVWSEDPAIEPYFIGAPSSQNWGRQCKIADAGLDRRVPLLDGSHQSETVFIVECGHSQTLNYLHGRRVGVFANSTVQVNIFVKIFNGSGGHSKHPAHADLTDRMVCVQYNRGIAGAVPASPTAVWSFGTARWDLERSIPFRMDLVRQRQGIKLPL